MIETLEDKSIRDRFGVRRKEDGSKIVEQEELKQLQSAIEQVIQEKPIRIHWKQNVGIFQVIHIVCPERSHLLGDLVSLLENEQLLVKACEIVSVESISDIWICFCDRNKQLVLDHDKITRLLNEMVDVIQDPSKIELDRNHQTMQSFQHNDNFGGRIVIDNSSGPFTTVAVNTDDRFGLLYDLVLALCRSGYSIVSANITTREDIGKPENVKACDIFEICDKEGNRIPNTLEDKLRQSLIDACNHPALIDRRDNHILVELCYNPQMKCIQGITHGLRDMGLVVYRATIRSERINFVHDKLYIRKDSMKEWNTEERIDMETKVTTMLLSQLLDISIHQVQHKSFQ